MGFAFISYEDVMSTVLAVDNMNGTSFCGRPICVDHVKEFKVPRNALKKTEEKAVGDEINENDDAESVDAE